jgi:hypothetical protein
MLYSDLMGSRMRVLATKRIHFVTLIERHYNIVDDTNPLPFGDGKQGIDDTIIQADTVSLHPANKCF